MPAWLTESDVDFYAAEFKRTGFTGALNWYRNFDRNWELLAPYDGATIDQPALFIVGADDPVAAFMPAQMMDGIVTDLREAIVLDGVDHWVAQEAPDEVNTALLRFLGGLEAS